MYNKQPKEIGDLSRTTMNRMVALSCVMLFVLVVLSARMGIIDFWGGWMTLFVSVGSIALSVLLSDRTTYLPFLGESVIPAPVLKDSREPADATVDVEVTAVSGATHVLYWASDVGQGVAKNPWTAYQKYDNSGVAKVDSQGKANLRLRCPSRYAVRGKVLPRHVHFRSVFPSGLVSKIETRGVVCA